MKYVFREYDKDLIPVSELPNLFVSEDKKAVKVLLNFLSQDVGNGKVQLRGEFGFQVNLLKSIESAKASIADIYRERNPLRNLAPGNISPDERRRLADRIFRDQLQDFIEMGFLKKSDISAWLASKGIEIEWVNGNYGDGISVSKGKAKTQKVVPAPRARVGWQVALSDSWVKICQTHGRTPTASEAIKWLRRNDKDGVILDEGKSNEMWWQPQRGGKKRVSLKQVQNKISDWKVKGVIPT